MNDLLVASQNKQTLNEVKENLKNNKMKDLGAISKFLGIEFQVVMD